MFLFLIACQKDIPEPESKSNVIFTTEVASVAGFATRKSEPFNVKHFIKGNDVYVECMILNFSFRNTEKRSNQTGKMLVYVNGKKKQEISSAAFIIKDLNPGNHRITLQIINGKGQMTSLKKEFVITIP